MRNSSTRITCAGVLACVLGLLMVGQVFAQSDSGRLQGVVTDSSGAVVSGAAVSVQDVATNRMQRTITGEGTGAWSFPALPPGNYELVVSKTGFKTMKQGVTLETAQVAAVNLTLQPGEVSTEVVVSAEAALVDTASSDIGLTVQTKQIQDLPVNGRNFTELATLIPGVTRGVPGNVATGAGNNAETFRYGTSGGASLVVNGSRPQSNNFMLDGLDNNESLVNTIVFFPNAEAIQEFKVQTSVPPAEFGRAGGATVNTTLKSGTNEIHGSAWDYLRNSFFDARPTFASSIAPFRRNQFGGTLGAPIKKDKLFIFGDYQGFRQETPVGVDFASVPTALMRPPPARSAASTRTGAPLAGTSLASENRAAGRLCALRVMAGHARPLHGSGGFWRVWTRHAGVRGPRLKANVLRLGGLATRFLSIFRPDAPFHLNPGVKRWKIASQGQTGDLADMKHPSPLNSNVAYMAELAISGFKGALSVGRRSLKDEPASSVLSHSVRDSWKPAAIGAGIGVLASVWNRDTKLPKALWGGIVGSALGFAGGVVWNSRSVTGAVVRGAIHKVNAARDERWLQLNPINYG